MSVERLKENKYKIVITIGWKNGKKIRYVERFTGGLRQARLRENELKIQLKQGNNIQKSYLTFDELSKEYLDKQKYIISPKTYVTYEQRIKVISDEIGNVKLKDLNTKILEIFYQYMKKEYISERTKKIISNTTLQHYYTLINSILEQAIKWDYIKTNPNNKIDKPKRERKEIQVYTKDEVIKLLEVVKNESLLYQAVIYLALDLGCREGELVALTWKDINLSTGEVKINKSVQVIKGKTIEKETKSVNSDRSLYITGTTINILKKYKLEQNKIKMLLGKKWKNDNKVLVNNDGKGINHDTPYQILKKLIKKYNLKNLTFHGLRHTNASLKIEQGLQSQIISKSLGHSSVQITHKYYSHFYEDEFKEMSNVLEDNIFSKIG